MNNMDAYENEIRKKLEQIPVPDVDPAWDDMRRKLEEEDHRGGWIRRRSVLIFLCFLLVTICGAVLWNRNDKVDHEDERVVISGIDRSQASTNQMKNGQHRSDHVTAAEFAHPANPGEKEPYQMDQPDHSTQQTGASSQRAGHQGTISMETTSAVLDQNISHAVKRSSSLPNGQSADDSRLVSSAGKQAKKRRSAKMKGRISTDAGTMASNNEAEKFAASLQDGNMVNRKELLETVFDSLLLSQAGTQQADSLLSMKKPVVTDSNTIDPKPEKRSNALKDRKEKKGWLFAGYAGIRQTIPVGDQRIQSYGFNGKKAPLLDYIPSIHLRAQHGKKWFLQLDLAFASAQADAGFSYFRKTDISYASHQLTTVQFYLEKTYYHEALLGFHHKLGKAWVAGAGLGWDHLFRSVSTKTVSIKDLQTDGVMSSRNITSDPYIDSFLYSAKATSFVQLMYEKKRWSAGIRAKFDLQPYIRYTTPEGEIRQRKYQSLDLLVRYRFWRSGQP